MNARIPGLLRNVSQGSSMDPRKSKMLATMLVCSGLMLLVFMVIMPLLLLL